MAEVITVFVDWPHAPMTKSLVEQALSSLSHAFSIQPPSPLPEDPTVNPPGRKIVQWATYDSIDHRLTAQARDTVLSSSYTFRKALIRKHFLSRTIRSYITKHPDSSLVGAVPRTWEIELAFADEIDEMWTDDLFDLAEFLEEQNNPGSRWCILKPGMADRGMGIRLFDSKQGLQSIFEEFEGNGEEEDEDESSNTAVVISHLRHFVVQVSPPNTGNPTHSHTKQEYLANPLLLDPGQDSGTVNPQGHKVRYFPSIVICHLSLYLTTKFHLRVYCIASGTLKVHLYTRILALFSSVPFVLPEAGVLNPSLTPHLTNTSLQIDHGESGVRLLDELVGCRILSVGSNRKLTEEDVQSLIRQMGEILSETFKAALENPVHFQVTF